MRAYLSTALIACFATTTILAGCGGGGGGSDDSSTFSGAATVSLELTPSTIDSGDETLVKAWVGDVHPSGVALKFKYPSGLSYVFESATLTVGEEEVEIKPRNNVLTADEKSTFLVFFLSQRLFRQDSEEYTGQPGLVQLRLVGKSLVNNGLVQVDADVDNPDTADSIEFNVSKPEFAAADQASITVVVAD
jgi:hypothetical protein